MALLVLNAAVAVFLIQRMTDDVQQLVRVEEPLEEAVLEMEINAGETARAVFDYLWDHREDHIDKMHDSEREFERFAKEFERLAETEEERELGRQVAVLYQEFKTLGDEITSISKRRFDDLQVFQQDVLDIDELIDEGLQPAIDRSAADALSKLEAALDMEINMGESFAAIQGYVLQARPETRRKIGDSEADFKRFKAQYRAAALSADEQDVLARIDKDFTEAVTVGKEILALTDELNEKLGKFEAHLEEIDRILDDEIQPLIHEQTQRAETDARHSGELAIAFMLVAGLLIFAIVVGVGRLVSKGIVDATSRLTEGAEQFSQGKLDHRIEAPTGDEFGVLAGAFNEMASRMQRLAEDNRRYQENLQQLVEKRTAALRESEERYRAIAEDTPVMICRFQPGGEITFVNQAYCKYFEMTSEELVGSSCFLQIAAEDRETVISEIDTLTADSPMQSHEHSIIASSGKIRWQRWTNHALFDAEGKVVNYQSIGEDITDRKRVEEEKARLEEQYRQAQRVESIGRLAGGVSHDLNNMLVPILGYAEMLLDELGPEDERRESVEEILHAGIRARDLVQQLLAFSRKQALEYKPVNLNKAIHNFEKLLRRTLREDIEIEFIPSSDIQMVMADIGQNEQVIMNLSVNAQDAMIEGGRLTIETASVDLDEDYAGKHQGVEPGRYVMLAVSDTGSGMDDEIRENLFEPFFSTKGEHGTGLGLSMVYGIVKQHGGNIAVNSRLEQGTTFKVYLPVSNTELSDAQTGRKTMTGLKGAETILLVEDNQQVRRLAHNILEPQGYTVLVAGSGKEALTILDHHDGPLHLLFTDVVMPGMNGKDLFAKATESHPELKVLYMSGYTDDVIAHRGVLDDGVQFIQKPFSVLPLAAKVREVLDGK